MAILERVLVSAGLAASMVCAGVSGAAGLEPRLAAVPQGRSTVEKAQIIVASWPESSRLLALKLLAKYGAPDEGMPHYLTWNGRKPFNAITVYADRAASNQDGILLETVSYRVPVGKWRALNAFGRGVSYDVILNELVACTDGEETDLLALNLADEVVQGRRSPDEARALFDHTLTRSYAGKMSHYLKGLAFDPADRLK